MGPVFLVVLVLVALCVLGLSVGILAGRGFPKYDVGSNPEMRRLGIRCFKDEDAALHQKTCPGQPGEACLDCQFYQSHPRQSGPPETASFGGNPDRGSQTTKRHPRLDRGSQTAKSHPRLDRGSQTA